MNHVQLMSCTLERAYKLAQMYIRAGVVPMLESSPGIGKSSLAKRLAKEFDLYMIDVRLATYDPTYLNGFPMHQRTEDGNFTGRADFLPMQTFPLEGDEIPINPETGAPYAGFLLFLDEFKQANRAVQAGSYRLILDKEVGDRPLHPKCAIMAAGNLMTDNAITNPLGTALQSRVGHIFIEAEINEFFEHAAKQNWDTRMLAWLKHSGNVMDFNPQHSDCTFKCPRTLEMLNNVISDLTEAEILEYPELAMGVIGAGAGTDFNTFLEVYKDLVTIADIEKDPKTAPLPIMANARWATVFMLSGAVKPGASNLMKIMEYMDRMDSEFIALFFQDCVKRNLALLSDRTFNSYTTQWQQAGKI